MGVFKRHMISWMQSVAEWKCELVNDKNKRCDVEAMWSVIQFGFIGIFKLIDLWKSFRDWFQNLKPQKICRKARTEPASLPCPCIYRFSRFPIIFFACFSIDLLKFYWGIYRFFVGRKLCASIVRCAPTTARWKFITHNMELPNTAHHRT